MHAELRNEVTELGRLDEGFLGVIDECDHAIRHLCERLLAEAASGRVLPPAAAWLIDHYSYVHWQAREIRDGLPRKYYRDLPRREGEPRVYRLAVRYIAACETAIAIDSLTEFFEAEQRDQILTLAELWAVGPLLKLVLIQALCRAASGSLETEAVESVIRQAITALRTLETASWRDFVESVSAVEQVLREDPAGVYHRMSFETRDTYRHAVEGVAKQSRATEIEVARMAVQLAEEAAQGNGSDPRKVHVGYYFSGPGLEKLRSRGGCRVPVTAQVRRALHRWPTAFYLSGVALLTAVVLAVILGVFAPLPWWYCLLLVLPASQAALAILNSIVHLLVPPRRLPRLDFSEGVPDEGRTFVVVPTLLLSRSGTEKLLETLEIHYLANREPNLFFALLTDFPDSSTQSTDQDSLLEVCAEGVRSLNRRHAGEGREPFYLFHRGRKWNASECVWMGPERKRGKLDDFNRLLLGLGDAFITKIGDLSVLSTIRYVLTLDSDTQLPRDTARELIGTMAHPLNHPVVDPACNIVREGYGILQPRVGISMESAGRSHLARIYSGQTGYDPYTKAVSDVYQDLHGQASFTGKGIYDVAVFHQVMEGRFPDNSLLSHDLMEGEHARVGLVTDVEVIDDYPATYQSYSKRKHRWTRGDWQIALWLFSKVPDAAWNRIRNPLSALSRWKIFDNLRRSLVEISLILALIIGWFGLPGGEMRSTVAVLALMLGPVYIEVLFSVLRLPPLKFWRGYFTEVLFRFSRGHLDALLSLVFLAHQASLMADAIVRTLVRRFITKMRLLEWESMAQSESTSRNSVGLVGLHLHACPLAAMLIALLLHNPGESQIPAFLILATWIICPLAAWWLNERPSAAEPASADDEDFLRNAGLRTWRYFREFDGPENNFLIPDNVHENPAVVARRTSITNIGLQLTANLAAWDFGYLTRQEFASRMERVLSSLDRLERYRGHFLNWYDIQTLQALLPRYVSTVDSGNLAASLITLKQGCLEMLSRPIIDQPTLEGLRDHCLRLQNALPEAVRTAPVMKLISAMLKQLDYQPSDLFMWEGVLSEVEAMTRRLGEHIEWGCNRLESRSAIAELRYWYRALSERVAAILSSFRELAPWLDDPIESELRLCANDSSMAELMQELSRVPAVSELLMQHDAIEQLIGARLDSDRPLHSSGSRALRDLVRALNPARAGAHALIGQLEQQAESAFALVREMDFGFLFNRKRKLLRIGYDVTAEKLEESHYDLLASEARTAVFLAIAKGDLPRETWFHLGRKLTSYGGHRTLLSWSGSMFEYLMPSLFMKTYQNTLLQESLISVVRIQQVYGKERHLPWGISEAAYSARDSSLCYLYHCFGVPALGAQRKLADNVVVAPYATMLALMVDQAAATDNLRAMASRGWLNQFGFYEAADFTARSLTAKRRPILVRSYMAHHQGMSLMALSNTLLGAPMRRRFHAEPLVQATEFLLQERLPAMLSATASEKPLAYPAVALEEHALSLKARAT